MYVYAYVTSVAANVIIMYYRICICINRLLGEKKEIEEIWENSYSIIITVFSLNYFINLHEMTVEKSITDNILSNFSINFIEFINFYINDNIVVNMTIFQRRKNAKMLEKLTFIQRKY